ncbi:hypothetical protein ASA1KI_15350 [Opitutales bacterium ASA1]|uniref:hypothetical protein n=1 Tax=Congregicoccus parvus TaxID=3081749 RepID=UPI002B3262C1|nr:hypothetical protein ASA1KI_15350 [Opitutales bacterium ASA1]
MSAAVRDDVVLYEPLLHPEVPDTEYKRVLRLPIDLPWTDTMLERALHAREWFARHARPWLFARTVAVDKVVAADGFALEGTRFRSRVVAGRIRGCTHALVVVASAGPEAVVESARLWAAEEPDRYYFLECFASATVEALLSEARARLCARAESRGEALLPQNSPGHPGWDVSEQPALFAVATARGSVALPGPLEVLDSGMPHPRASQLALFGLTTAGDPAAMHAGHTPCRNCSWMRCDLRREPFLHPLRAS